MVSKDEKEQPEDKSKVNKPQTLRDAVRMRPGMYFGGTDGRAMLGALYYVLEYVLSGAKQRQCNRIELTLQINNRVVVKDNGPGISVEHDPVENMPFVEALLYPRGVAVGNHNFLPCTNAASIESKVEVRRDGFVWEQAFQSGIPTGPLEQIRPLKPDEHTGNTFTFTLDPAIFDTGDEISHADLAVRLRDLAYMIPALQIILCDERQNPVTEHAFYYPNGLTDFLTYLNRDCTVLHNVIHHSDEIEFRLQKHDYEPYTIPIDFAIQFTDGAEPFQLSYVNFHETIEGGLHVDSLRCAVCNAIRAIAAKRGLEVTSDDSDLLRGMSTVIRVDHPIPIYADAMGNRLINPDLRVVETVVFLAIEEFFAFDWAEAQARGEISALQRVLARASDRTLPVKERRYGEFAPLMKYDRVW